MGSHSLDTPANSARFVTLRDPRMAWVFSIVVGLLGAILAIIFSWFPSFVMSWDRVWNRAHQAHGAVRPSLFCFGSGTSSQRETGYFGRKVHSRGSWSSAGALRFGRKRMKMAALGPNHLACKVA